MRLKNLKLRKFWKGVVEDSKGDFANFALEEEEEGVILNY